MVKVKDLPDLLEHIGPRPMLHCEICGADFSADRGDYFMCHPDYVPECCEEPMQLVTKHTVYRKVES